jgi:hypothetical protein
MDSHFQFVFLLLVFLTLTVTSRTAESNDGITLEPRKRFSPTKTVELPCQRKDPPSYSLKLERPRFYFLS